LRQFSAGIAEKQGAIGQSLPGHHEKESPMARALDYINVIDLE
jgi:hypothetical protein